MSCCMSCLVTVDIHCKFSATRQTLTQIQPPSSIALLSLITSVSRLLVAHACSSCFPIHAHPSLGPVTFNLDPPKIGSPGTNFSEIFGPPPKNLFHYKGQRHEGKPVHASCPEGAKENQHVRVRCWSVLLATGSLKW